MVKYDFYIHTYHDDPTDILAQIKQFHPSSKATVISDVEDRLKIRVSNGLLVGGTS